MVLSEVHYSKDYILFSNPFITLAQEEAEIILSILQGFLIK